MAEGGECPSPCCQIENNQYSINCDHLRSGVSRLVIKQVTQKKNHQYPPKLQLQNCSSIQSVRNISVLALISALI
jgi:hypothetical protein